MSHFILCIHIHLNDMVQSDWLCNYTLPSKQFFRLVTSYRMGVAVRKPRSERGSTANKCCFMTLVGVQRRVDTAM